MSAVANGEPVLLVEDLRKSYGDVVALDGVSLSVRSGEIFCLLGRNGAGKSTFVSVVSGLARADSGRVRIAGQPVRPWDAEVRSMVGVAAQETGVYPPLTVYETLRGVGRLYDLKRSALLERIEEVSDALDLGEVLHQRVQTLSGGQRRRLHTALALIHRPKLLLLDEPTAGVDVQTRTKLLETVRRLAADGTAICYSTHYLPEVEALDAWVGIMEQGRLIASGSCRELVAGHGTGFAELSFSGPTPRLEWDGRSVAADESGTVRIPCVDPGLAVPVLMDQAQRQRCTVEAIQIVRPNLEGVFLTLTGERFLAGAGAQRD